MAKHTVSFTREVSYEVILEDEEQGSDVLEKAWAKLLADPDKYEVFDEFSSYARIERED
jgi:hypothetical protein